MKVFVIIARVLTEIHSRNFSRLGIRDLTIRNAWVNEFPEAA